MSFLTLPFNADEMDPIVQTYITNHHLPLSASCTPRTSTSSATSSILVAPASPQPFASRTPMATSSPAQHDAAIALPVDRGQKQRRHRRSHAISLSPPSSAAMKFFASHSAPTSTAGSYFSRSSTAGSASSTKDSSADAGLLAVDGKKERRTRITFSDATTSLPPRNVSASHASHTSPPTNAPRSSASDVRPERKGILRNSHSHTPNYTYTPSAPSSAPLAPTLDLAFGELDVSGDREGRPSIEDRHDSSTSTASLASDHGVDDDDDDDDDDDTLFEVDDEEEARTPGLDDLSAPRVLVFGEHDDDVSEAAVREKDLVTVPGRRGLYY